MCGLFGFIGESKNNKLTENLTNSLFVKTQIRGLDASGFYCAEGYPKKQVAYFKKPIPATEFVNSVEYKKIWQANFNLGIFHCRAASVGVGIPAYNENNHPFVSNDFRKAVIHNGVIQRNEYDFLKQFYEVETECDSEVILRILEQEEDFVEKARKFLHYTENSHYAVAFAEIDESTRKLHLFRNIHRPLVLVDMTELLGQIFFCSTPEIFFEAYKNLNISNMAVKIYEVPPDSYIELILDHANKLSVSKYNVFMDRSKNAPVLEKAPLLRRHSEWKNTLNVKNIDEIKDILIKMSDKLVAQANLIDETVKTKSSSLKDKQKIQMVFGNLKDMNKRCDLIIKSLGEL